MSARDRSALRCRPVAAGLAAGAVLVLVAVLPDPAWSQDPVNVLQGQETTTTTAPPPTTTPLPPTTTTLPPTPAPPPPPTTAAPTTVPATITPPPPATTVPATTTTTSSSTTTTTAATTTTTESDDDDSNLGTWLLIGLVVLALLGAIGWLVATLMRRRQVETAWDGQRTELLDEAQRAHDDAVDLVARWMNLSPDQLSQRWSQQMAELERLRGHLSSANANAPEGAARIAMQEVASRVDDLRIALGQTDLSSAGYAVAGQVSYPPAEAQGAAEDLQEAIRQARQPGQPRPPRSLP
jgi:hypothetical protein